MLIDARGQFDAVAAVEWAASDSTDGSSRMWAIAFDFDTAALGQQYPGANYNNAYQEFRNFLQARNFTWTQGSLYFGGPNVTPVDVVLAVSEFARTHAWFNPQTVNDMRMLRIEEKNDLMPVLVAEEERRNVQQQLAV